MKTPTAPFSWLFLQSLRQTLLASRLSAVDEQRLTEIYAALTSCEHVRAAVYVPVRNLEAIHRFVQSVVDGPRKGNIPVEHLSALRLSLLSISLTLLDIHAKSTALSGNPVVGSTIYTLVGPVDRSPGGLTQVNVSAEGLPTQVLRLPTDEAVRLCASMATDDTHKRILSSDYRAPDNHGTRFLGFVDGCAFPAFAQAITQSVRSRRKFKHAHVNIQLNTLTGSLVVTDAGDWFDEVFSNQSETQMIQTQPEFTDYNDWLNAARTAFPEARHNKKGTPGWVRGYGEEDDEEFVTGPDMQADVVAVWVQSDGFGWVDTAEVDACPADTTPAVK